MPSRSSIVAIGAAATVLAAVGPSAAAASLPDGRVVERASQTGGNGTPLIQTGSSLRVLDDDTVVATNGVSPLSDAPSGAPPTVVMRRTSTGWTTHQLMPSNPDPTSVYVLQDATPDLRAGLFFQTPSEIFSTPAERAAPGRFLMRTADGGSALVFEGAVDVASDLFPGGLSADGSTAYVAASSDPVSKEALRRTVFSWTSAAGTRPVAREAGDPLATCSTEVQGGFYAGATGLTTNAVSADGRSTFVQAFRTGDDTGAACPSTQQTFLVRDGRTVTRISAPTDPAVPASTGESTFVAATPDAGTAYFRTGAKMSTADGDTTSDVYRWRAAEGATPAELTCVSCGAAAAVTRVVAGPQGDVLYLLAGSQLLAVRDGATTTLDSGVSSVGGVSRNGAHVVYAKGATLWTSGAGGDAPTCVSCRADGTAATGQVQTAVLNKVGPTSDGTVGASSIAGDLLGAISDDGTTVAFVSDENITGDASDGPHHAFRWKRGQGVALIADDATNFGTTVSPSGNTVFFAAYGPVAAGDDDRSQALYAARVGGGFAVAVPPAPCSGEGCRPGGGSGPVAPQAPGSTAPAGVGNATPTPADDRLPAPAVAVLSLSSSQRAAAARTGTLRLRVTVAGGGTVKARATARIGRRTRTVATTSRRTSTRRATVTLSLRLSSSARSTLRRTGRLRVRIVVSLPKARTRTTTVTLTRKRG
ncbi:unannotated protein [freshwater metagenome]|uniref:Unannotated protein n=1 Tax=freshwater metagenome TaxID=449393 RepID=A0A6J7HN34_9ZZZZ|nr:hypothetical protein [Actinomycetota bacterium]